MSSQNANEVDPNRKRRLGRVCIHTNVVDNDNLAWAIAQKLCFMPWHVEYDGPREVFNMLGTSPHFRELEVDEPAPFYDVTCFEEPAGKTDDGETMLEFRIQVTEQPADVLIVPGHLSKDSKVAGNG